MYVVNLSLYIMTFDLHVGGEFQKGRYSLFLWKIWSLLYLDLEWGWGAKMSPKMSIDLVLLVF